MRMNVKPVRDGHPTAMIRVQGNHRLEFRWNVEFAMPTRLENLVGAYLAQESIDLGDLGRCLVKSVEHGLDGDERTLTLVVRAMP